MTSHSSRTVLVTGSSSGLGRATVEAMVEKGWVVFASMRDVAGRNAPAAAELTRWAESQPGTLRTVQLDVTDDRSVEAAVEIVIATAGSIDVVVNNAGVGAHGLVEAFTPARVRALFDVNVLGALRVNRAVLPHLRRQRSGLLIQVSSTLGRFVLPFSGVYAASKFAVEALAESYRYDLMSANVDSVIVEPASYPTRYYERLWRADDGAVQADYGVVAELADRSADGYARWMAEESTANPREVAEAIIDLIEAPAGARPTRTAVGRGSEGIRAFNNAAGKLQAQMMAAMGVAALPRDGERRDG